MFVCTLDIARNSVGSLPHTCLAKHQMEFGEKRDLKNKRIGKLSVQFLHSVKSKFLRGILCQSVRVEGEFLE